MTPSNHRHLIGELRPEVFGRLGLEENPFGTTPNPKYLYESQTHREAKSSLIVGLEFAVGFQALIAAPGMGKTTILSHILEKFQHSALTAFLFQEQRTSSDFLSYLLSELGSKKPPDAASAQDRIHQLLARQCRDGRPVIVAIDEAQNLNLEVMETVRLLSNFETASEKLVHIIFSGQPQFGDKLACPELTQLRQRISIFTTLTPFDQADTEKYIEHRLRSAGYSGGKLFSDGALDLLWTHSYGIPRNLNSLCMNALLLAASSRSLHVDEDMMLKVLRDGDLDLVARPASNTDFSDTSVAIAYSASTRSAAPDACSILARLRTIVQENKLSREDILRLISEAAQTITSANGAAIAIKSGSDVVCQARTGEIAPQLGSRIENGEGISGQCLETAEPLLCKDAYNDIRIDAEFCHRLGVRSIAVVPIGKKPVASGVLEVLSQYPERFHRGQLSLLQDLAELVSLIQLGGQEAVPGNPRTSRLRPASGF